MTGRPKLALTERYSLRRGGRYVAYRCKPLRDPMIRITYCGKEIGLVSDDYAGQVKGFRLIEAHKEQKRVERYERAYLKLAGRDNRATRSEKPPSMNLGGRPLIEPIHSRKLGAYLLKRVGDGWEAWHKNHMISRGSYDVVYRAMRERQTFWRKARDPQTIQNVVAGRAAKAEQRAGAQIALEGNRRNCYQRRVDADGTYVAIYCKRVVVRAHTADACELGIREHWSFVLPIRSLAA